MPSGLAKAFDRVASRLRNRPDTEHAQALIRVVLVSLIAIYLNCSVSSNPAPHALWGNAIATGYTFASIGLVCWIVANPGISYSRRYLAMIMEHSLLSACIIFEGDRAAPLFLIYVWVSLGNGFRYGVSSLMWSTAVSTVGFCAVIIFSDYFRAILPVSIGILLTMIAIPLYSASLIRQLRTAKTNAEQANRAKSRFLATASHELRTPLHSIISLSDLLQSTPLTTDQSEMIRTVRNSGDSLLHLVEDVLDISSIEAGRLVSYLTDFELYSNLAETVAIVRPQALAKGLGIGLYITPDTPNQLTADWKHLGQILLNLLTNAIKFTSDGRVDVAVSCSPGNNASVRFVVSDTGIGMDAKTIPHIFETFVQSDETATRSYGGVGLGLAIVRQIVTLLGGAIQVSSEVGKGSQFTVDVPVLRRTMPQIVPRHRAVLLGEDKLLSSVLKRLCPDLEVIDQLGAALEGHDSPTVVFVDRRSGDSIMHAEWAAAASSASIVEVTETQGNLSLGCATTLALDHAAETIDSVLSIAVATAFRRQRVVTLEAEPAAEPAAAVDMANATVLVVDDSAVNRMVTEKVLHSGGFDVVLADGAESALEILIEQEFDILLLDINMPGQSGIEIIKTYSFMRMGMDMPPIVVFSAEVTPDTRRECAHLGVSLFLPKPSEPKFILSSLRALLPDAIATESESLIVASVPEVKVKPELVMAVSASGRFPIIDRHTINNLLQLSGDTDFLTSLMGEFASDAETVLTSIDRAVYQRDLPDFWDQVHALRSSAANVGAYQILAECTAATARGRASFLTHGSVYAGSLRQEYSRFIRATGRLQGGTNPLPLPSVVQSRERG